MSEEMDGKNVHFPPESAFSLSILLSVCTLTWRVKSYVSRQREGIYIEERIVPENTLEYNDAFNQ